MVLFELPPLDENGKDTFESPFGAATFEGDILEVV